MPGRADCVASTCGVTFRANTLLCWRRVSHEERPGAWLRLVTVRLASRAASKRRRDGAGATNVTGIGLTEPAGDRPIIDARTGEVLVEGGSGL